ncbi:MAG: hypothetical protein P8173_17840, partial [Gammaproteobacteria bacterium]
MSVFNRRLAIIVHDLFMVALAWMLAYLVRYNFLLNHGEWTVLGQSLVMVTVVQGLVSWRFGLYRGVWRFASIPDLWNIIRAVFLGLHHFRDQLVQQQAQAVLVITLAGLPQGIHQTRQPFPIPRG